MTPKELGSYGPKTTRGVDLQRKAEADAPASVNGESALPIRSVA